MEKEKFDIDLTFNDESYLVKISVGREVDKTFLKKKAIMANMWEAEIVSEEEWRNDLEDKEEFEKLTEVQNQFEFWNKFIKFWDNYDLKKFHEVIQAKKDSSFKRKKVETISVINKWFKKSFILQVEGNFEAEIFEVECDSRKEYRKMKKWEGKEWENFLKEKKLL